MQGTLCDHAGGRISVEIDDDGLRSNGDAVDEVATTNNVKNRLTNSDIVRDRSGKCNVRAQYASTG